MFVDLVELTTQNLTLSNPIDKLNYLFANFIISNNLLIIKIINKTENCVKLREIKKKRILIIRA